MTTPRLGIRLVAVCPCGAEIFARHRNRLYCSRACAQRAYRWRVWARANGLDPTDAELDRLVASQLRRLPDWWEASYPTR